MRRIDLPSLAGGLAVVVLGTVLLLDRAGEIALGFGWFLPLLAATLGVILLASGLATRAGRD